MESESMFDQDNVEGVPAQDGILSQMNESSFFKKIAVGASLIGVIGATSTGYAQENDEQPTQETQVKMQSERGVYNPYSYEAAEEGPYSIIFNNPDRDAFLNMVKESLMEDLADKPSLVERITADYARRWDEQKASFDKLTPQDQGMFKEMWEHKIQPNEIEVAPDTAA